MLIADVAERAKLSEDTIRFYEKSGMLPPIARDARGWRVFTPSDLEWLETLRRLRDTGMPLAAMKRFATSANGTGAATRTEQATRLAILRDHAAVLDERRRDLETCGAFLTRKIAIYTQDLEDTDVA